MTDGDRSAADCTKTSAVVQVNYLASFEAANDCRRLRTVGYLIAEKVELSGMGYTPGRR
jgi:hypothetical protein